MRCILLLLVIVLADTQMNGENPFAARGGEAQIGCELLSSLQLAPLREQALLG